MASKVELPLFEFINNSGDFYLQIKKVILKMLRNSTHIFFSHAKVRSRKLIMPSLDWTRPKDPPLALGHASILTTLKQHKIQTYTRSWSVNHRDFQPSEVSDFIMQHAGPETDLALGAFIWNEPYLQKILTTVKHAKFPGKVILGGPQVSYVKSNIEELYSQADIFIRGYGESALARLLLSAEQQPVIAGVHYAGEVDLGLSANVDLESIPSPYLEGVIKPQRFLRFETQRGCPFRCSFCQHRESDITQQRRYFDQSRLLSEIEWICKNSEVQDVAVLDPTFNSGPNYMDVMRAFVKHGYTGKLSLQCRMEMVTQEFFDVIEELNKTGEVVLEFGLQTIHKHEQALIQRPNNMTKVRNILTEVQRCNISTEISLIFGLPGQTLKSFKESVDFCKQYPHLIIYAFPLMILRGTPLHDNKHQLGLIESTDVNLPAIPRIQNTIPHVVASQTFSFQEWQKMAEIAESLDEYNQSVRMRIDDTKVAAKNDAKMKGTLQHTMWHVDSNTKQVTPDITPMKVKESIIKSI